MPISSPSENRVPRWICWSLWLAGIYNLIWGSLVITMPRLFFTLSGISDHPVEIEIWQCLGMVVGVYGVGYLIAAPNPVRHWPIVLVGLLGKVLGPLGFVLAIMNDSYWLRLVWLTILNDLIWWPSFLAALWYTARANQPGMTGLPLVTEQTLSDFKSGKGESLDSLSQETPLLVVFLRHAGCTFCREALADLRQHRKEIEGNGVRIALVHMGSELEGRTFFAQYGLDDVPAFSDPERVLYRYFELKLGRFGQLFGPRVWWRGFMTAIVRRHGVGKLQGNGFQMAGTFLLDKGRVVRGYRLRDASDRPDYCRLAVPGD